VSKRGVHAEQSWSLRQASMTAIRGRTPGQRPSPRPIGVRQPVSAMSGPPLAGPPLAGSPTADVPGPASGRPAPVSATTAPTADD
jgi:hypothetical protein